MARILTTSPWRLDKRLFKGAKAPDAPDPYKTAAAQGQANKDAALLTAELNRYNTQTPFGTTTWSKDPNSNQWTQSLQLDPMVQGMLERYQATTGQAMAGAGGQSQGTFGVQTDPSALGQAQALRGQAAGLAGGTMSRLGDVYSRSFDYGGAPDMPTADEATRQRVEDAVYGRQTARLDPQFAQGEEALRSRLANQGITEGSEAYGREMDAFARNRADAYAGARQDATTMSTSELGKLFSMGLGARQQGVSEANYLRDQPLKEAQAAAGLYGGFGEEARANMGSNNASRALIQQLQTGDLNERLALSGQSNQNRQAVLNELLALTTGSQLQNTGGNVQVGAAPIADSIYNSYQGQLQAAAAKNASRSGLISGLGQLGTAGAMYFSDRRVKENIRRIGTHPLGIGLYAFDYKPGFGGSDNIGVMADEVETVRPEAVFTSASGYKMVDYSLLETSHG